MLAIVNFSLRDGIDTVAICSQLSKLVESYTVLACKGLASECQILQTTTCTRSSMLMPIQMFARGLSQAGDSLSEMNAPVVQQNFLTLPSIVGSSMLSDRKLTHRALLRHLPHDREAAVEMLLRPSYLTSFTELLELCVSADACENIQIASVVAMGKWMLASAPMRARFLPHIIELLSESTLEQVSARAVTDSAQTKADRGDQRARNSLKRASSLAARGTALAAIVADCLTLPGDAQMLAAATACLSSQLSVPDVHEQAACAMRSLCGRRQLHRDLSSTDFVAEKAPAFPSQRHSVQLGRVRPERGRRAKR